MFPCFLSFIALSILLKKLVELLLVMNESCGIGFNAEFQISHSSQQ